MTKDVICATEISKKFKERTVLKNCTMSLSAGSALLLLGENGSGKSTFLRIITGLLKPHKGVVQRKARSVGYCGHVSMLYEHLSVIENLKLFYSLSVERSISDEHIREALKSWGILEAATRYPTEISQGQRARVSLCRAFLTAPELLVLDEPDASLDGKGTDTLLCNLTEALKRDAAIVVASHRSDLYQTVIREKRTLIGGELRS